LIHDNSLFIPLILLGYILVTIIFLLFNHGGHVKNENQENDDKEQMEYLRKYSERKNANKRKEIGMNKKLL